jgi:nicotinic acid mononucleotide adenylyltransferase
MLSKTTTTLFTLIIFCAFSCSSLFDHSRVRYIASKDDVRAFPNQVVWYMGSFDPPARGHLAIVDELLRRSDGDVYLTINHNTAKNFNASIRERVDMLSLAYENEPRVRILREPIEGRRELVVELNRRHERNVLLAVGEDVLEQNYKILGSLDDFSIVSFFRAGQESDFKPSGKAKVFFEKLEGNGSMSSTLVRNRILENKSLSKYLTPEIERYIRERNLYKKSNYNQHALLLTFLNRVSRNFPLIDLSNAQSFTFKETQSRGGQIDAMIRWMLRESNIPDNEHRFYIEVLELAMGERPLPLSFSSKQKPTCKKLIMTMIN